MQAIIPPDALYGTVEKRPKFAYVDAADFNDSKVRRLLPFFTVLKVTRFQKTILYFVR